VHATCPECTIRYSIPKSETVSTTFIVVASVYLAVCVLSTLWDLADRYRRELARMKLSKVQRQVKYEEQQRKLMKELIAD
jgi:hypothetical protein